MTVLFTKNNKNKKTPELFCSANTVPFKLGLWTLKYPILPKWLTKTI